MTQVLIGVSYAAIVATFSLLAFAVITIARRQSSSDALNADDVQPGGVPASARDVVVGQADRTLPEPDEALMPQVDTDDAGELHEMAALLRRVGRKAEAMQLLRLATESTHGTFADYHNSAVEAESLDDLELAARLYRRALDLQPMDERVLVGYADCLSKMGGHDEESERIFQELLQRSPESARATSFFLDHLMRKPSQRDAALEQLDRLRDLSASSLDATRLYFVDLRTYHQNLGMPDEELAERLRGIVSQLELFRERFPSRRHELARLFAALASLQQELDRDEESRRSYQEAVRLGLSDRDAIGNLAVDMVRRGQRALALRLWQVVLNEHPEDERLWKQLLGATSHLDEMPAEASLKLRLISDGRERLRVLNTTLGPETRSLNELLDEALGALGERREDEAVDDGLGEPEVKPRILDFGGGIGRARRVNP